MDFLCTDYRASNIINKYLFFCAKRREGALGKNAQFWMSYLDQISIVLQLMRAVKGNDFELYVMRMGLKTMGDMDNKIQVSGSAKKIVELKQHSNITFQLLVKLQALDTIWICRKL